jgi:DNA-binding NtrC family response regulator
MGETILLVEDHLSSRANISEFLRRKGYKVAEAPDGLEALNLLSRRMIDLMVLDVVIPQIHGLNLLKLVRSNTPALPVIVISAYLSEPVGKVILEGSAEFFSKPLDLQQLSQIIQTLPSTAPRPH